MSDDVTDGSPDPVTDLGVRYLELIKGCILREVFAEEEVRDVFFWDPDRVGLYPGEVWQKLTPLGWRVVKHLRPRERRQQLEGRNYPPNAETMIGRARLDNVEELATRVVAEGVPGDFVETGVWRGGAVALMRAVLVALGDDERHVWACDSFQGLPPPDVLRFPMDRDFDFDKTELNVEQKAQWKAALAVPVERVRRTFERYGLLDDSVHFVEGWFKDTLPDLPVDRISLLRLDGDLYESTMDALSNLEARVSSGGFVIVDDYLSIDACRQAVDDYRDEAGITSAMHEVDWTGVWWRKD